MDSVCADTSLTQQPAEIEVMDQEAAPAIQVETVKESWKIWNFHLDLQLVPTVPNGTFLYCQETNIITQKTQNC